MHPVLIVGGILHATAVIVIAFFVLFAASKASGWLKILGTILGGWLIVLAILGIVIAAVAPSMGMGHHEMRGWMTHQGYQAPAPPTPTAPAKPTP